MLFIGKEVQRENDLDKILEEINQNQKIILGKLQTKFNNFHSSKKKYQINMLAILYSTYLSTLAKIEENEITEEDFNLIKSLYQNNSENINNNFVPTINLFRQLNLSKQNSSEDLYQANLLQLEKKKSDLKISKNAIKEEENYKMNTCIFCTDDFEENGIINPQIMECKNYIHGKCFINYIEEELNNNRFPIRCPLCTNQARHEINYKTILDNLILNDKDDLAAKLETISLNHLAENNSDEITFCPTAGCNYMCYYDKTEYHLNCPLCKKNYCLNCKTEWHTNKTCEEYQREKKESDADAQFENYVKGSKLKQCPNCKRWVEKISGCNHINCTCGASFCYNCGKLKNGGGSHGCSCMGGFAFPQGGLFGNPGNNNQGRGLFGNPGNNNQGVGLFGNPGNNNQGGGLFGNPGNNNQRINLFGNVNNNNNQVNNNYNNNQNNNIFLANYNNNRPNLFDLPPRNELFTRNIFGNNFNNNNNIFRTNNEKIKFGFIANNDNAGNNNNNNFGILGNNNQSLFGNNNNNQSLFTNSTNNNQIFLGNNTNNNQSLFTNRTNNNQRLFSNNL